MALYHFAIGDLYLAIPAAVMAVVFGLEWAGVPLLGRTVRIIRRRRGR